MDIFRTHGLVCWPCDPSKRVTWGWTWAGTWLCAPISNVHTGVFVGRVRDIAGPHGRVSPVLYKNFLSVEKFPEISV